MLQCEPMNFSEYQLAARKTQLYTNHGENINYVALGLGGEAGELLNKTKKIMRDHNNVVTEEMRADLKKELGDVLWYIAAFCDELKLELDDVAQYNIEKLSSRQKRDQLHGDGDNR